MPRNGALGAMRLALLVSIALLLLAPTGEAQFAVFFDVLMEPDEFEVAPGSPVSFDVHVMRVCQNGFETVEAQDASLQVKDPDGIAVVDTPAAFSFERQVCAMESSQEKVAKTSFVFPASTAWGNEIKYTLVVQPGPRDDPVPATFTEDKATALDFVVRAQATEPDGTVASGAPSASPAPSQKAPALPSVLLASALVAFAVALRRRE
jgi:hypothetical protein